MVDPTILAIGAVTFLVVLILILRNGAKEEPKKPSKKDKKQKQLQAKQQKPKKGRSALKKSERAGIPSEWQVVGDSAAKDANEVLEFLKGKDPNEIAKQQATATKAPSTKKKASNKKNKDEVQSSEDSATDNGSNEGFKEVKKKAPTDKKKENKEKKEKKQDEAKDHSSKPYFKPLNPDGTPIKDEKGGKRERKPRKSEGDAPREAEGQQKEGEKRERKAKSDGEKREPRERKEGGEGSEGKREPREPKDRKPVNRPVTSPPIVKQEEQAGLDEILNTITQDFRKEKPKKDAVVRHPSVFSKLERTLVKKILGLLSARDLVALSAVNHHLCAASRNNKLWQDLCVRDFGLAAKDAPNRRGGHRTYYRNEFLKRKSGRKTKKDDASTPQGEEKDTKGKKKEQASKEVVQE